MRASTRGRKDVLHLADHAVYYPLCEAVCTTSENGVKTHVD